MTCYEIWSLIITGTGVLVGIGVLVIYILQLRAMNRSVIASRDAAQAAKVSADALIASQRPQIAVQGHGYCSRTIIDQEAPRLEVALFNRGQSTAYDVTYESWVEVLPLPFIDFTPSVDYFKSSTLMILNPNHAPVILNIPIRHGLKPGEREGLIDRRLQACFRIRVEYKDAFSASGKWQNFGFFIDAKGLSPLPKYNDAGEIPN